MEPKCKLTKYFYSIDSCLNSSEVLPSSARRSTSISSSKKDFGAALRRGRLQNKIILIEIRSVYRKEIFLWSSWSRMPTKPAQPTPSMKIRSVGSIDIQFKQVHLSSTYLCGQLNIVISNQKNWILFHRTIFSKLIQQILKLTWQLLSVKLQLVIRLSYNITSNLLEASGSGSSLPFLFFFFEGSLVELGSKLFESTSFNWVMGSRTSVSSFLFRAEMMSFTFLTSGGTSLSSVDDPSSGSCTGTRFAKLFWNNLASVSSLLIVWAESCRFSFSLKVLSILLSFCRFDSGLRTFLIFRDFEVRLAAKTFFSGQNSSSSWSSTTASSVAWPENSSGKLPSTSPSKSEMPKISFEIKHNVVLVCRTLLVTEPNQNYKWPIR